VKTIVQGLGGSIRVDSRQGDVTTFTVDLPLDGSAPIRRAPRNIHREGRNLGGSRK
jgi:hypothetical protein